MGRGVRALRVVVPVIVVGFLVEGGWERGEVKVGWMPL